MSLLPTLTVLFAIVALVLSAMEHHKSSMAAMAVAIVLALVMLSRT